MTWKHLITGKDASLRHICKMWHAAKRNGFILRVHTLFRQQIDCTDISNISSWTCLSVTDIYCTLEYPYISKLSFNQYDHWNTRLQLLRGNPPPPPPPPLLLKTIQDLLCPLWHISLVFLRSVCNVGRLLQAVEYQPCGWSCFQPSIVYVHQQ